MRNAKTIGWDHDFRLAFGVRGHASDELFTFCSLERAMTCKHAS